MKSEDRESFLSSITVTISKLSGPIPRRATPTCLRVTVLRLARKNTPEESSSRSWWIPTIPHATRWNCQSMTGENSPSITSLAAQLSLSPEQRCERRDGEVLQLRRPPEAIVESKLPYKQVCIALQCLIALQLLKIFLVRICVSQISSLFLPSFRCGTILNQCVLLVYTLLDTAILSYRPAQLLGTIILYIRSIKYANILLQISWHCLLFRAHFIAFPGRNDCVTGKYNHLPV